MAGTTAQPPTQSIGSVTPTVCALMGAPPPSDCRATSFALIERLSGEALVERCLIYAADAVAGHLFRDSPDLFDPILRHAPHRVPAHAALPSVTPVCFATMFTGAPPEVHGIRKYEKPTLRCDTLFDAFLRAGKRVAIVAVAASSIDLIFRGRDMDYFTERYDPEVTDRALALLQEDRHDVIVAYHEEYDDTLHATNPWAPEALAAVARHVESFEVMAMAAGRAWKLPYALVFATDHGSHTDPVTGQGTHGSDSPDDLEVNLFWRLPS
jgi:hypothetical protein